MRVRLGIFCKDLLRGMRVLVNLIADKGAFKYYVSRFGGMGGLSQNADTADALEGSGGSDSKC